MKILQINSVYNEFSSTGRNVYELHHYLIDKGEESFVISFDKGLDEDNVFHFHDSIGSKMHAIVSRVTGLQGYFSLLNTKKVIEKIDSISLDVVFLHVLHSNCINLKELFSYFENKSFKVVLVLHDVWYFTGHCCYFTQYNCMKWQENCGNCPGKKDWNTSWIFDQSRKCLKDKKDMYSKISNRLYALGVSDWIAREANKSILHEAKQIIRVYNWIDLDIFKPTNKDKNYVLCIASLWTDNKGLSKIVQFAKDNPEIDVHMIGKIESTNLPKNIKMLGVVKNQAELAEEYANASVFLNPSIQETFGKTTAESLACGTPVIVLNTTACPELVDESVGHVVEKDDQTELNQAVLDCMRKDKSYYSKNCREKAEKLFDKDKNLHEYYEFIQSCITQK